MNHLKKLLGDRCVIFKKKFENHCSSPSDEFWKDETGHGISIFSSLYLGLTFNVPLSNKLYKSFLVPDLMNLCLNCGCLLAKLLEYISYKSLCLL